MGWAIKRDHAVYERTARVKARFREGAKIFKSPSSIDCYVSHFLDSFIDLMDMRADRHKWHFR